MKIRSRRIRLDSFLLETEKKFIATCIGFCLLFGIIFIFGCTTNSTESPLDSRGDVSTNIYYENVIEIIIRDNPQMSRNEAEELIYNKYLKDRHPVSELLKGTVDKIVIEEHFDSSNSRIVAEVNGGTEGAESILTALHKSSASFGKTPMRYSLIIYMEEYSDPIHVDLKGGLFRIDNGGMYWSHKNLEEIISSLRESGEGAGEGVRGN